MSNKSKYIAELLGTMVLVLMGCGSAVLAGGYVGNLGIAFAFGFAVLIMVYAIGPVSGCHINPAITIAMWLNKKISGEDTIWYIVSQVLGAVLGAVILYFIASGLPFFNPESLGQNGYGAFSPAGYSLAAALAAETVFTALFLFVICAVCDRTDNTSFIGLAIGITLVLIHIVGIPVTGVSVNPARSIGPAFISGLASANWAAVCQLWVFIAAPIVGGVLGASLWNVVSGKCVCPCACSKEEKKK
ncbi:aquaporin Z [Parelusimicrobium proximum]|uniref:MIP family channel protein n=1 Tax=Parelusimicrobium proximum TaxID=3228953 RepID=UPI003D179D18